VPSRSRSRQVTSKALRCLAAAPLRHPEAKGSDLVLIACTSLGNAAEEPVTKGLVRITHPFHPYTGRRLRCVGERHNLYGKRLLIEVDANTVCSVPESWTDVVDPDPEIIAGDSRAVLRLGDLLELSRLVQGLVEQRGGKKAR